MSDSRKAVFLSYASQDAEAAKRICETLRAAGVEVWFDQNELVGGDAWDQKIRKQIKDCALLIPIISKATQARTEGYFRLEWRLADQRTHLMAKGRPFLLPVVIDDTRDADAHVPDSFTEVQWTRLPRGEAAAAFAERVKKLLGGSELETRHPRPTERDGGVVSPAKRAPSRPWLVPAMFGVAALAALALWQPWRDKEKLVSTAAPATAVAPLSEARRLIEQTRALLLKPNGGPSKYETATLLCERALALDPTAPEAWAVASQVDTKIAFHSFDRSERRIESARSKAAKAINLAPDAFEARLAQGMFQAMIGGQPVAAEAEAALRALRAENPREYRVFDALGVLLRDQGRGEEAVACFDEGARLPNGAVAGLSGKAWALRGLWRLDEADAALDQSIALQPIAGNVGLKVFLDLSWRGDPDRALATLRKLPADELTMDVGVAAAVRLYRWRREPAELLKFLAAVPRDWMTWSILGPKAALTGDANAELNRPAAARTDWQTALTLVEQRLAATPNDRNLFEWKAYLEASLGEKTKAEETWQRSREAPSQGTPLLNVEKIHRVVPPDQVIDELERRVKNASDHLPQGRQSSIEFFSAADLRLNPAWDDLRSLPRFQALQARLDADPRFSPTAKKTSAAVSAPDEKSVAVLAFANLSDDKANEYFSDGISEELLNVLAKIPGLKVSARTSAFYFKGKQVPIPEIAQKLGVAYVVEGSVRKSGSKVRITAQLIKAEDGFHVWSENFDRELKDIFAVQDEIAGLIAQNLKLKLAVKSPVRSVNPAAYDLWLQGRTIFTRGNPHDYPKGIQHYKEALALEEDSAQTWAALAIGSAISAAQGELAVESGFAQARTAADRALALDADSAQAYYALGLVRFLADWDWVQADASYQRALALAPSDVNILSTAATLAQTLGQSERALRLSRTAGELDPLNFLPAYTLAKSYMQLGRYDEMEKHAERMIAINSDGRYGYVFLAFAHLLQGRVEVAAQVVERMKPDFFQLTCLALVRHAQGRPAESDAALNELKVKFSKDSGYQIAEIYAYRQEPDRAFEWLEAAYRERDPGMTWLTYDPFMKNVRADARWPVLLKKMNLPDLPPK